MRDEDKRQQRYQEWKANKEHPVGSLAFESDEDYQQRLRDEAWKEEHERRVQAKLTAQKASQKSAYAKMKGK